MNYIYTPPTLSNHDGALALKEQGAGSEAPRHLKLVSTIERLLSLKEGWLEGHGVALNLDDLNWLKAEVAKSFPETLDYPSVMPTEDGNVVFEWIRPHARIELEVNFKDRLLELYATGTKTDGGVDKLFQQDQWRDAFKSVAMLLS